VIDGQRRLRLRRSAACDVIASKPDSESSKRVRLRCCPPIHWKVIRLIRTLIGAALTAVAVSCAPLAHATAEDDKFLQEVAAAGIEGPPDQLIADGHAACDNYGNSGGEIAQLASLSAQGLSQRQINTLILAGFKAYCPDKLSLPTWNR